MQESTRPNGRVEETAGFSEGQAELEFDLNAVRVEPLEKKHNRGAFECTNLTIQNYCRHNARRNNDAYMVRVFVACHGDSFDVLGYYYLSLTSYKIKLDDQSEKKFERVDAVPAVYLGMIGVHTSYQGKGIGQLLMLDAIQRTAKIAQHAGTYALALDAIDEKAAGYYTSKFGFSTFKGGSTGLEMFLPIRTILDAAKASGA